MEVEYNRRSSNVTLVSYPPKSYAFFSTRGKSSRIYWTKLKAQNVEFWCLLSHKLWLLTLLNFRDVVNHQEFFAVGIFSTTSQVSSIMREGQAFDCLDRHQSEGDTSGCLVVPDSYQGIVAFLGRSNHGALHVQVKAADWSWVTEEKLLLRVVFGVHGNQSSSRCEDYSVFTFLFRPL